MTTKRSDESGPFIERSGADTEASTTTLTADAATASSKAGSDDLRLEIVESATIRGSTSIQEFFAKPTRISTGNFTTADVGRVPVPPANPWFVDQILLTTAAKSSKFSGNMLWRGDIVLRLQVNATRFQTGRYILAWFPSCGSLMTDPNTQAFYRMHSCNLMQITQLPHVEIDLAKQTTVELKIPFTSIFPFHTIKSTGSDMGLGCAFIFPYVKLAAGSGNTSVPWVLWANFENVVLSGPVTTQSGLGGSEMSGIRVSRPLPSTKIRQDDKAGRYQRANIPYPADMVHNSMSHSLGAMQRAQLPESVGQGSGISQTNLLEIAQRPAYMGTGFVWSTTTPLDTQLFAQAMNPNLMTATYGKGTTYTPLAFVASLFKLWRGSLIFRFKLVKNEFYSGRLGVMFQPTYRQTVVPTNKSGGSEYSFREIIDIRDTSEFEVRCPYISPELLTASTDNVGWLTVDVIDPLLAPNTVDQNISVMVEVFGGDDISFQYPLPIDRRPWAPVQIQSGKVEETVTPRHDFGVSSRPTPDGVLSATTGEEIKDVRLLIKRFCTNPGPKIAPTSTSTIPQTVFPFLLNISSQNSVAPNALFKDTYRSDLFTRIHLCYGMSSGGVRLVIEPWEEDNDDIVELGMDYDSALVPTSVNMFFTYEVNPHGLRVPIHQSIDGLYDVTIPAYSRVLARSTAAQLICSTDTTIRPSLAKNSKMTFLSIQNVTTQSAVARAYQWHRMAADDTNFHVWLGTVPLTTEAAT